MMGYSNYSNILISVGGVFVIAAMMVPLVVIFTNSAATDEVPRVNTTVGLIRGLRAHDGSAMFLGIPYATIDENNPFGTASPNPPFEDVFNAFNDSAICPQLMPGTTLDCLHLNVHVPRNSNNDLLPVFVYIHGGGFTSGSSGRHSFGPRFLIRHNVIFVSLNYRLAAYGFMCLQTADVPGNQGLKDQLLALRWIKNNIRAFGGDDESITIAGDSAGGRSVDLQLLFAEDGLFHKVISLSGNSLSPTQHPVPDLDAALKISFQLGLQTNDNREAIAFLSKQTPIAVLTAAQAQRIVFGACVEKEIPDVERFITIHPVSAPVSKAKDIPLIMGYTDDESLISYLNMHPSAFESLDVFNERIKVGFQFGDKHDLMKSFVRRFYAADEPMSFNLRRAVIDFESDFRFNHPTQRSLKRYLDHGGVAYHYVFSYIGNRNMQRVRFNITEGGVPHADDLTYFLDMPDFQDNPTPNDQLMIDRVTTFWTNFAKYGNPTPSTTELVPVQWLPVTHDRLNYMNLTLDLQLQTRPFHKRLSFWDLFYHTNREYVSGYTKETFSTK